MDQATKNAIAQGLREQERRGRIPEGTAVTWSRNLTKRPANRTSTDRAEVKRLKAKVNRHIQRQNQALAYLLQAKGGVTPKRAQFLITKAVALLAQ